MSTAVTLNETAAAATIRDGFDFVFSTTYPARKDRINVPYHIRPAVFKPRA
jgi:hypothetical protein